MKTVFNHEQDHSGHLDGVTVDDAKGLCELLDGFADKEPFVAELVGENGYTLMIGVGKESGCVQHSRSDSDPPYLVALAPGRDAGQECQDEYVEFLVGNTPSPVPKRNCLPMELVKEIAVHFIETGERSKAVNWEEV